MDESEERRHSERTAVSPPGPGSLAFGFETRLKNTFAGSTGLGAGWRFLFYLAMRYALYYFLMGISIFLMRRFGIRQIWFYFLAEVVLLTAAVVPASVMARIENRRFGDYGLPVRVAFGRLFWVGALWGIAALTVLMLGLRGAGVLSFAGLALHGLRILKFGVFWAVFFLLVGFAEEFYVRGYSQFALTQGIGFWPAALLLSIAFGALHFSNSGESRIGLVSVGLIGLFFCLTLRRTGNLWFAVGFHMSWDWGESYLYSVPDSGQSASGHLLNTSLHGPAWLTGGSVGPEGSWLVFVTIALVWIVFDRVYREVKYRP